MHEFSSLPRSKPGTLFDRSLRGNNCLLYISFMILVDCTYASRGFGGIAQDNRAFASEFSKHNNVSFLLDKRTDQKYEPKIFLENKLDTLNKKALLVRRTVSGTAWGGHFFQSHLTGLQSPTEGDLTFLRIHDLFPLTNPEWFTYPGRELFKIAAKSIKPKTILICNSKTTQAQVNNHPITANFETMVVQCQVFFDSETAMPCGICYVCNNEDKMGNFLLAVGTIEPRKNYGRLLEAWSELRNKTNFDYLIIAGRLGWNYKTVLNQLRGVANLLWMQPCNHGIMILYGRAAGFISASLNEGFDMPSVEASTFGIDSALSDIAVHHELCPESRYFFNPSSVTEIKKAIVGLSFHSQPQLLKKMKPKPQNDLSDFLKKIDIAG